MLRIEFDVETSLTPEQVTTALTDFSDRRTEIWPDLASEFYEVYSVGETTADAKEGTSMPGLKVWAKEHYDWSQPGVVEWRVVESNFSVPASGIVAKIDPTESGGSRIHITWERAGSNLKGRVLCRMMKLTNGSMIKSSLRKSLGRMEKTAAAG